MDVAFDDEAADIEASGHVAVDEVESDGAEAEDVGGSGLVESAIEFENVAVPRLVVAVAG